MKMRHLRAAIKILLAHAKGKLVFVRLKGHVCFMQVTDIRIIESHILVYLAGVLPVKIKRVRKIIVERKRKRKVRN